MHSKSNMVIKINKLRTSFPVIMVCLTYILMFAVTKVFHIPVADSIGILPFHLMVVFLWMTFLLQILQRGTIKFGRIKTKGYLAFFIIWIIYALISLSWAPVIRKGALQITFLLIGCSLIFFSVYYFKRLEDFKILLKLWISMLFIMLVLGFVNILSGYYLDSSRYYGSGGYYAPTAIFYNENDFALYLGFGLTFLISSLRYTSKTKRIAGVVLLVMPALYLLIETGSAAVQLAFMITVVFWLMFMYGTVSRIKVVTFLVFSVLTVWLSLGNFFVDLINKTFYNFTELLYGIQNGVSSGGVRINLIKSSIYFFIASHGRGVGAGGVEYYMANYSLYDTRDIANVHNWWFEILANYGIFIFIGYLIMYLFLFRNLFFYYRHTVNLQEKNICEALLLGMVMFILGSTSSSSVMGLYPQWMFFAFAIGFLNYLKNRKDCRP